MGYFYLFLFTGIFYFFGNVFFSGWDIIPSSMIDGQFTNYIFEHYYLFLTRSSEIHASFMNLPIYYPMPNILAYSDTLLSIAPIYVLLRFIFDYSVSYSMTVIIIYVLDFVTFYFLLKKFKYSKLLSSLGAFLFTFSYVYRVTIVHIQLITLFFTIAALLALLNISKHNSRNKNTLLFIGFALMISCQFYSSFYLGFYTFYLTLIAVILCSFNRKIRKKTAIFFIRYKENIILSSIIIISCLIPLAKMYLQIGLTRPYNLILENMPTINRFFTGHTYFIQNFVKNMEYDHDVENMLMFTYALLIFGIIGLFRIKKYGPLLVSLFFIAWFSSIKLPGYNNFSLWHYIYSYIPGAIAIRETIRIILVLNPLLVLGFINFINTTKIKRNWIIILIVAFVLFEQFKVSDFNTRSYSSEKRIQEEIEEIRLPVQCKFLDVKFIDRNPADNYNGIYRDLVRVSLMWFASRHGFYFVSGYSGISESEGFSNPYRQEISQDPRYCLITRYVPE